MIAPKPVPRRTPPNLVPPNRTYTYSTPSGVRSRPYGFFEGGAALPFEPGGKGWNVTNATWLADAALLAYEPHPGFRAAAYASADFEIGDDWSAATAGCTVVHRPDVVLVAFRGTRVPKPGVSIRGVVGDWLTDARARLVGEPGRGRVHRGFQAALNEVWVPLSDKLRELARQRVRPVWFVGHSLGAALATLAAARHGEATGVYAIASPRVGDRAFVRSMAATQVIRVVHGGDVVTKIPPEWAGYEHAGEPRYVSVAGDLQGGAPGGVSVNDHAPLFYAVHLWNVAIAGR